MSPEQHVAAVILAAGAGSRFGSPKPMAEFDGSPLLDAVVGTAREAGLSPIVVVTSPSILAPDGIIAVRNDRPADGMSRSLRLGLAAVPDASDAALVLLADQPTVSGALLRRIVGARGTRPIVATVAHDVAAPPVLVEREAFALAESAVGDAGLRDVLRSHSELVTRVEVVRHPVDVDEPSDLLAISESCPGCRARYGPMPSGETHPYIGASPACWAAFGELLAREFGDPAFGRMHRHSVDAYTSQHPGTDGWRQRRSLAIHLIGLCHWLEHGLDAERINAITRRIVARPGDWPWLAPPARFELTVCDVLTASDGAEHQGLVRRWAEDTWGGWVTHHQTVRRWAASALD